MRAAAGSALRLAGGGVNLLLGIALLAAAAIFTFSWVDTGDAPLGSARSLVGALWLAPTGALFLVAAFGVVRRWRWWPAVQLLPLLYPIGFGWLLERI
jgi:hypothetical protein